MGATPAVDPANEGRAAYFRLDRDRSRRPVHWGLGAAAVLLLVAGCAGEPRRNSVYEARLEQQEREQGRIPKRLRREMSVMELAIAERRDALSRVRAELAEVDAQLESETEALGVALSRQQALEEDLTAAKARQTQIEAELGAVRALQAEAAAKDATLAALRERIAAREAELEAARKAEIEAQNSVTAAQAELARRVKEAQAALARIGAARAKLDAAIEAAALGAPNPEGVTPDAKPAEGAAPAEGKPAAEQPAKEAKK